MGTQKCTQVPDRKCHHVPTTECQKQPKQGKCHQIPKKSCAQVAVKVPATVPRKCASRVVTGMVGSCTYSTRCNYLRAGSGAPGAHFGQHLTPGTSQCPESAADRGVLLFELCETVALH